MSTTDHYLQGGHNPPTYLGSNQFYQSRDTLNPEKGPESRVAEITPVIGTQLPEDTSKKSVKSRILFWFSLLAGVLWLAPITYLLYINFTEKIIGASAWCPHENCSVISYSADDSTADNETETTYMKAIRFSKHDHNLLGVLQFVAKVLEIWFIAVAASLVYTLSRMMATKPGGLPLGHLLAHIEFADILSLTNSSLYKSTKGQRSSDTARRPRRGLFILFVTAVVFLCILANLIGPMTAVLLMPSLEPDYQTPKVSEKRFSQMRSGFSPSNGNNTSGSFIECDSSSLETGNYTCFRQYYGSSLDTIFAETLVSLDQVKVADSAFPENYTPALENGFPFSFNMSESEGSKKGTVSQLSWATNRQVIRELSRDFNGFKDAVLNGSDNGDYKIANKSLSVTLQREAPITGFESLSSWGDITVITIDDFREIRCISDYLLNLDEDFFSKCFRTGKGWNSTATGIDFVIDLGQNDNVTVQGYWSDKSAYFPGYNVSQWNECLSSVDNTALNLSGDQVPEGCDWESMFNQGVPTDMPLLSSDAFIFEFWNSDIRNPQVLIYEIHPSWGKANYSVDITQVYPEVSDVKVEQLPQENELFPIVINPEWLLATWGFSYSSDNSGSNINSTNTEPCASAAGKLKKAVNDFYNATSSDTLADDVFVDKYLQFYYITQNMALQMLSLITYDITTEHFRENEEKFHPELTTSMRLKLWKWGIESKTSMAGAVVTLIACVVVIVRSVLVLIDRTPKLSTIGIIASLMEHAHNGELQHVPPGQRQEAGMVRFRMPELHEDKIRFERP